MMNQLQQRRKAALHLIEEHISAYDNYFMDLVKEPGSHVTELNQTIAAVRALRIVRDELKTGKHLRDIKPFIKKDH